MILNGSVEIFVPGEEPLTLHLGDSFGVEPTLKKMRHRGVMKTRVDDCQVTKPDELLESDSKQWLSRSCVTVKRFKKFSLNFSNSLL